MKVVINRCYGGFGLSAAAYQAYCERKKRPCYFFARNYRDGEFVFNGPVPAAKVDTPKTYMFFAVDDPACTEALLSDNKWYRAHVIYAGDIPRHDPDLVSVVESLGEKASGQLSKLHVVEVPDGTNYEIDDYDGMERVAEAHRTWS